MRQGVHHGLEKSFARYTARIIRQLRQLDSSCLQSGDSRLRNVWEEYKIQVQLQQSVFFSFYAETVQQMVEKTVGTMRPRTVAALWHLTAAADAADGDASLADGAPRSEAVIDELLRRIQRRAADEPLPPGLV